MTTETLLQFPCDFPIKAFGHSRPEFDGLVAGIVRRHAPDLAEDAVTVRPSQGGKFTAVTVTIRAESKAQLDAIYQDLTRCSDIIMAL
ncbi:YbeD family protein [Methylocaldum sp. MU1018]|jgi:putative lipoic acid-binding regulatory protein